MHRMPPGPFRSTHLSVVPDAPPPPPPPIETDDMNLWHIAQLQPLLDDARQRGVKLNSGLIAIAVHALYRANLEAEGWQQEEFWTPERVTLDET